ncbi:hypothetical protein [Leuconostoc lactis]|uniref:hypothetical protein n=1 Tax=Leuconostoc lactis TaxID=1246 RepID=UPI0024AD507B|nr:hypothetical protein [Leuconostoc lactis]MDI6574131.1 hypothetical protein [Leuconostoc lactis]
MTNSNYNKLVEYIEDALVNRHYIKITMTSGEVFQPIKPDDVALKEAGVKEKAVNTIEGMLLIYTTDACQYFLINPDNIVSIEGL